MLLSKYIFIRLYSCQIHLQSSYPFINFFKFYSKANENTDRNHSETELDLKEGFNSICPTRISYEYSYASINSSFFVLFFNFFLSVSKKYHNDIVYWMYTEPITKNNIRIELLSGFSGMIRHWSSVSALSNSPDSTKSTICPSIFTPIHIASFPSGLLSFLLSKFLIIWVWLRFLLSLETNGACFWWTVLVTSVMALILSCSKW